MAGFRAEKLTSHLTRLYGLAGECMYLAEGSSQAVLIDAGWGFTHLKPFVNTLTQKPIALYLTHGHPDHLGGGLDFEDVYMNPKDQILCTAAEEMPRRRELFQALSLPESAYLPRDDSSRYQPLFPGNSIDLGGFHVDFYGCAGHTPGSLVVLFREDRILLTGDACAPNTLLLPPYAETVEAYHSNLKTLHQTLAGRYDRVVISHGSGDTSVSIVPEMIQLCEAVMNHLDDALPYTTPFGQGFYAKEPDPKTMTRTDGLAANLFYQKNRIFST